ncbi:MAG: DUF3857 domain-containing protein, partial [Deltaproteobacteria bacterium]|nr:DUF3857 domain-containing protein [Deltaproteobacteria bacterium]
MKKMMLPVLSIFILLSPPGLPAFPGHISEMSKKASHFKDSDSVILLEEVEFRLRPDGRISRRHHVVRLLLTEYAVNMLNDPKIKYNSAKEDLNIIRSRTYTAGSGEIDTGINGFNPITPFELEKAPFYTNFKEMIVTHIGVEKGAVTELDYETTDKEPWRAFAGAIILSGKEPYAAKNIKITVPDGVKLYFRFIDPSGTFGNAPLAQVSSKGGETVYSWRVENIEPSESFSDAPPGFYPVLYFSTETPAGADVKFLNSLCQIEAGKYIKEKTAAIIVKSLSSSEKLSKILDYLSERINPVAWYAQDIYAQARDGDEIILSGYGT